MTEGPESFANHKRLPPPASLSPLSSHSCSSTQTWLPAESPLRPPWSDHQTKPDEESGDGPIGMQLRERSSSRFCEELVRTGRTAVTLMPLAGALVTSSEPQSNVVKQGYLGKLERNHRRYFVLRAGSHTGPSRLEWYKSQETFTALEKAAGKAALFGSSKQGVIYLRCCLGISRIGSSRKGHAVALYAKDKTMVLVMAGKKEQEDWYVAIKNLKEEEQKDEEHGEGVEEEDDGYYTLPPAAFFKEVWPVVVKPRGLGTSKSLTGENRLCLTAMSLILVRVGAGNDLPSVTIPLLGVRRFGHLDGLFYLEVGRSAPNGPGEIWMEAREQAVAQHIHEAVREMVRTLRALPDFSRSPASSHSQPQAFLASKRCRPIYRENLVNVRTLGPLAMLPRAPYIQTSPAQCYQSPRKQEKSQLESSPSSTAHLSLFRAQHHSSESGSYMEMKTDQCSVGAHRLQAWEKVEEEEVLGYMTMSPQVCCSSSVLPQDDYVTMASPHKYDRPSQKSFSSSTSVCHSPLHPSSVQSERNTDQSQMSISYSAQPQDNARQEQTSAQHSRRSAQTSPVESVDGSDLTPFALSGPVYARPLQAGPVFDPGQSSRLQTVPAVRRYWPSLCLPSCLQAEDR